MHFLPVDTHSTLPLPVYATVDMVAATFAMHQSFWVA
jgi:hypothetical protein